MSQKLLPNNKAIIVCYIIAIIPIIGCIYLYKQQKKVAYMLSAEVFSNFKGKKDLEVTLTTMKQKHKVHLDSLSVIISELQKKDSLGKITKLDEQKLLYFNLKNEFQELEDRTSSEYTERVWIQINQYVKDFGEKQKYDYIFGVAGQGNLMYATSNDNITSQIIEYINYRYEGNK